MRPQKQDNALIHPYDAMGNLIHNGSHSYTYDVAGRMVAANAGATGATYQVNASGLRVRKDVSGVGAHQELVTYNGGRQRVGSYRPNGSGGFDVEEELVYLPGSWRLLATVRGQVSGGANGMAYPILSDQIEAPRTVLDPATGDRRWTWVSKEAFGDDAPNGNPDSLPGGSFTFDARFPGQFLDAETGLFHNGYRDYDAKMGRYVQSDPIELKGGWNTYGYALANPVTIFDSLGLSAQDVERIQQVFGGSVERMTKENLRNPNPVINNTFGRKSFLPDFMKRIMGHPDPGYLNCVGQSEELMKDLNNLKSEGKLDDGWWFAYDYAYAHQWVVAIPFNKNDKPIWMDPRANEISFGNTCPSCKGFFKSGRYSPKVVDTMFKEQP